MFELRVQEYLWSLVKDLGPTLGHKFFLNNDSLTNELFYLIIET